MSVGVFVDSALAISEGVSCPTLPGWLQSLRYLLHRSGSELMRFISEFIPRMNSDSPSMEQSLTVRG